MTTMPLKPSENWTSFATRTHGSWPLMRGWPAFSKASHPKTIPSGLARGSAYEKALHASSARLFADALASDPKLAEDREAQHSYNAACAAALAGSGQGKDELPPDLAATAKLRQQALDWLKAELAAWAKVMDAGPAELKAVLPQTLKHWKTDTDLAGIRDEKELAKLPEAERAAFRKLWKDVDQLLTRAAGSK